MLMVRCTVAIYLGLASIVLAHMLGFDGVIPAKGQYLGGASGVYNLGTTATVPPVTGCNAGQLDFSDACDTTQYMVLLK
jgi:hypothetical protein